MSEFVDGFDKMGKISPCISIYGSARTKPDNPYYQITSDIAKRLVEEGFGVITGGGPGIMEAGNKGARSWWQIGWIKYRIANGARVQPIY